MFGHLNSSVMFMPIKRYFELTEELEVPLDCPLITVVIEQPFMMMLDSL